MSARRMVTVETRSAPLAPFTPLLPAQSLGLKGDGIEWHEPLIHDGRLAEPQHCFAEQPLVERGTARRNNWRGHRFTFTTVGKTLWIDRAQWRLIHPNRRPGTRIDLNVALAG